MWPSPNDFGLLFTKSHCKSLLLMLAGVEAEKVGADAAYDLMRNIDDGGCVDEYLQDQVCEVINSDVVASTGRV